MSFIAKILPLKFLLLNGLKMLVDWYRKQNDDQIRAYADEINKRVDLPAMNEGEEFKVFYNSLKIVQFFAEKAKF